MSNAELQAEFTQDQSVIDMPEAAVIQAATVAEQREPSAGRRLVALGTTSVVLVLGACDSAPKHESPKPSHTATATASVGPLIDHLPPAFDSHRYTCNAITDAASDKLAKDIISNSKLQTYSTYTYHGPLKAPANQKSFTYDEFSNDMAAFYTNEAAAKETGVHLSNPAKYLEPLERDLSPTSISVQEPGKYQYHNITPRPTGPKLPISTYIENFRGFMATLGIDVKMGQLPNSGPNEPNTSATPNPVAERRAIVSLIKAYSTIPKELLELDGTKHFVLGSAANSIIAQALTAGAHDTIYANLYNANAFSLPNVTHEQTHPLDAVACGGPNAITNDPKYAKFNQGRAYSFQRPTVGMPVGAPRWLYATTSGGNTPNLGASLDTILSQLGTSQLYFQDRAKHNYDAACNDARTEISNQKMLGAQTDFVTPYSETFVQEDIADTSETEFVRGQSQVILNPNTPNIHGKYELLLSRLAYLRPHIAEYIGKFLGKPYDQGQTDLKNCRQVLPAKGGMK